METSSLRHHPQSQRLSSASLHNNSSFCAAQWSFDPVTELPGDLAALCLSFVGFQDLLKHAQSVCRAWRDAIDGGLPAVWYHEVCVHHTVTDRQLAMFVRKSHGAIRTLNTARLTTQGLDAIRTLSDIRVLHISLSPRSGDTFSKLLPSFPLLADLKVSCFAPSMELAFPTLPHLKSIRCDCCNMKGLHNLPSLTNMEASSGSVDADEAWPASIREVSILCHPTFNDRVLDRIAALQHLTVMETDWSFVDGRWFPFFTPPYNQLSFLPTWATVQRLSLNFWYKNTPPAIFFNSLTAMQSLRNLRIGIRAGSISDQEFQGLKRLANLEELCLISPMRSTLPRRCLQHISTLPHLTSIWLFCDDIADYSPLGLCSQLRYLRIADPLHQVSHTEVQAITQLQLLETLDLHCEFAAGHFALFCTMRSLRHLLLDSNRRQLRDIAVSAVPPILHELRTLRLFSVKEEDVNMFVDWLVQMPKLIHIVVQSRELSKEEEARVRGALPFLETLRITNGS